MPSNNLRIVYDNIISQASSLAATSSNSAYPVANLQSPSKTKVWRSTSTTAQTLTINWTTDQNISCVILPYTNLSSAATITIKLYNASSLIYTSSTTTAVTAVLSSPYKPAIASGVYRYSFGINNCARKYFTQTAGVRKLEIILTDASNSDGYIEAATAITGTYWSPTYNTSFGVQIGVEDSSTTSRTQAGNLVTDIGTSNKTLQFELNYLTDTDRDYLFSIINSIGKKAPIYVSLFPEDTDPKKEQTYQIYGKLRDMPTLTHPMYTVYSSSISIEEI